jgi:hypothetical protein
VPPPIAVKQGLKRKLKLVWAIYWAVFVLFVAFAASGGGSASSWALFAWLGVAAWLAAVTAATASSAGKSPAVWGCGVFFLGPVGALFLPATLLLSIRET